MSYSAHLNVPRELCNPLSKAVPFHGFGGHCQRSLQTLYKTELIIIGIGNGNMSYLWALRWGWSYVQNRGLFPFLASAILDMH